MRTSHLLAAAAALALSALGALPARAALAPNYQRLVEISAVLEHPGVAAAMPPIDRVEYVGPDLYRVTAGRCHLDVRIVDLPTPRGLIGARHFEARPGRRVCAR